MTDAELIEYKSAIIRVQRKELAASYARLAAMHRRAQRAESEVARLRRQLAALIEGVAVAHPGEWDLRSCQTYRGAGVPWPVANAAAILASVRELPPWGPGPKPSPAYVARQARDRRVSAEIRAAMSPKAAE